MDQSLASLSCAVLSGVGPKLQAQLAELGIQTVQDVLFHLPLRYEDRTRVWPINRISPGAVVVVCGTVDRVQVQRHRNSQMLCRLHDGTGSVLLRFFHFHASQAQGLRQAERVLCFGECRLGFKGLEMVHPEYRLLKDGEALSLPDRLTPIYPSSSGLQQRRWYQLTTEALARLQQGDLHELLPASFWQAYAPACLREALRYVHRPPPGADQALLLKGRHAMQRRLIFEELLAHRLAMLRAKQAGKKHRAWLLPQGSDLVARFLAALPFQRTGAQQKVCTAIADDLARPYPMLRLLQGDVGSGKTLVAACAILQVIAAKAQAVLMVPTEILAEQHAQTFGRWFEPLGLKVVLCVAKLKAKARREALAKIASGEADVVIGTHAVFQATVVFKRLALLVVDEQHRFGVHQRLLLREKACFEDVVPHQLVMTATPIPRTLAMSAYANLDVSVIDELPPGRQPVDTVLLSNARRQDLMGRISGLVAQGQQVYWVCPLIEDSDVLQCQAAQVCVELLKTHLPEMSIALVHGRMKPAEKEAVMAAFVGHQLDVLVATTVIEVGVDVPNASLMVIENAERLGLSQLHQLRGRVGRGVDKSFCVMLYQTPLSQLASRRLKIMRESCDGFYIAEQDLAIRGPGEVLGTKQTGVVSMKVADIMRDQALLPEVSEAAAAVLRDHTSVSVAMITRWLGDKAQCLGV